MTKAMNLVPTLGLVTKPRPFQAPFGAFADGSKNFWLYGNRCSTPPGFDRLTTTRPNAHTTKLSGQWWRGNISSATNVMARVDTTQTFEMIVTIDRLNDFQVLAYKGQGEAGTALYSFAKFDWSLCILPGGTIAYAASTGAALLGPIAIAADGDGKPLLPGNKYAIAVVNDSGAIAGERTKIYLQRIGSSNQAVANGSSTLGASTATFDVFFAASPVDVALTPTSSATSRETYAKYQFQGSIQEVRVWSTVRTPTEIKDNHNVEIASNASGLVGLYRLTGNGTDTYFVNPTTGTVGSGAGQMPRLELEPRDATWISSGHVLGNPITGYDYSLGLNGRNDGLVVPDYYRFRNPTVDSDGQLTDYSNLWKSMRLRTGPVLKDRACLWHATHIPGNDFANIIARKALAATANNNVAAGATTGSTSLSAVAAGNFIHRAAGSFVTNGFQVGMRVLVTGFSTNGASFYANVTSVAASDLGISDATANGVTLVNEVAAGSRTVVADEQFIAYVEQVDTGGGTFEFAAVLNYYTGSAWMIATAVSNTGGLTVDTEYDVTAKYDITAATWSIQVGASAGGTQALTTPTKLHQTPDVPEGSYRKYAFVIGNAIYRARMLFGQNSDPNYFDVEYDYSKSWNGVIGHLVVGKNATAPAGSGGTNDPHKILRNVTKVTKAAIAAITGQVYSAWTFDQGKGGEIKDLGLNGTTIPFAFDSGHTWGESAITTAAREKIRGIFEHQYSDLPTAVARIVCIAGGSAYSLDVSTGALTFIADGFRNDLDKRVSFAKAGDAIVMCSGSPGGNYQLTKDQIVKLSIDKPRGLLPWGLVGQMDPTAGLKKGEFVADVTNEAALEAGQYKIALAYYNANLDKWSQIVPFATVPILYGRANIQLGTAAEINQTYATLTTVPNAGNGKEPFGVVAGALETIKVRSYLSTETSPKDKKVIVAFTDRFSHPFILDTVDCTALEWKNTWEAWVPRIWCDVLPDGRFQVNSRFIGSTANLRIDEDTTSVVSNDFNSGGSGVATAVGTGVTGHGRGIQKSFDPQVTHVGIFRTVAGGEVYRLVDMIANGETDFTIKTTDSTLGGFTLDPSIGPVPSTRLVTNFGSRMYYILDDLEQSAIYPSQPGLPWALRTGDVVLLKEGSSNPVTGIARTEQTLTVFKRNELFVITETTDPNFPFQVDLRVSDEGCVAPFGIINISEAFHFPALKGFSRYDTASLVSLSDLIEPTYRDGIAAASRAITEGVYDRKNRMALWFTASGNSLDENENPILDQVFAWDTQAGRAENGDYYGWQFLAGIYATTAAAVHDANGTEMVLFADPMGYINRWDSGTNFGLGSHTALATPALDPTGTPSQTTIKLAAITALSYPEGYVGFPITVIDATDGTRETRMVKSDDLASPNSTIVLDHALSFNVDHAADTVIVGSIEADWTVCDFAPFGHTRGAIFVSEELIMHPRTPSKAIVHRMRGILGDGDGDTVGVGTIADDQIVTVANGNDDYLRFLAYQDQTTGEPRMPRGTHMRRRVQALGADVPFEWLGSTLVFEERGKLKERA